MDARELRALQRTQTAREHHVREYALARPGQELGNTQRSLGTLPGTLVLALFGIEERRTGEHVQQAVLGVGLTQGLKLTLQSVVGERLHERELAQGNQAARKGRLTAFAHLLAERAQLSRAREPRRVTAVFQLEHLEVLEGLKLVVTIAAGVGERARTLELALGFFAAALMELQHAERIEDGRRLHRGMARACGSLEHQRLRVTQVALEQDETTGRLGKPEHALFFAAAAAHQLGLQRVLLRIGPLPALEAQIAEHVGAQLIIHAMDLHRDVGTRDCADAEAHED